jgi:hypothetical protein
MYTTEEENKAVLIIDSELPTGIIANTAAILGITLGYKHQCIIGEDITDTSNQNHLGITNIPIPVLKGTKSLIKEILAEVKSKYRNDVTVIDFSKTAQLSTDYDDYTLKAKNLASDEFEYLGIGIYRPKKILNKLTGSIALLR